MLMIKSSRLLILVFIYQCLVEPSAGALPASLQNLELDDITSLWDKFPSIIVKIKEAVNRFRCPKGWRRLGGSCYYLSNLTSTSAEANLTCNFLHSNQSNLMQIRNTVELFYAAHVLTKNNLSSLMIDIDMNLLKGKTLAELLMDDQGRWQRMKDKFRELRVKYYKMKATILDELDAAGLRISRRSKKIQQETRAQREKYIADADADDDDADPADSNHTSLVDYEYDDLNSPEEIDESEHIDDIHGICDQIEWNVLNNDSTVYILTSYLMSDKIVCSLSDVDTDVEYPHVCEYVLDFCFANVVCGTHGRCVNTIAGFKCSCGFLYGGVLCEKISKQGYQILIGIVLVVVLYGLSLKPVRWVTMGIIHMLSNFCKGRRAASRRRKRSKTADDQRKLVSIKKVLDDEHANLKQDGETDLPGDVSQRRPTFAEEFMEFLIPRNVNPLENPNKRDLVRIWWVGGLSVILFTLLIAVTTLTHFNSFKYDLTDEIKLEQLVNDTLRLVTRCEKIANYRLGNLMFFPVAVALILMFSWSIKREKRCPYACDGRPGMIPPIEPFRTANRFTTATVFGILAFEVLKIFEESLFSTGAAFSHGILVDLLEGIANIILVGLRYYPVLASLQLRNVMARFFVCLYILADIVYAIIREGSCMGFLPISRYYSALEEAKLRMELGTWFIVYGLVKNTPHFGFLSYIGAELCVRFGYDAVYVPLKKKQSIWLSPVSQLDESRFSKYYVTKLFRRNVASKRSRTVKTASNADQLDDDYEVSVEKKAPLSFVRQFFGHIYTWNEDFRFTTMTTCTYAVAVVSLYYLACTLVFLWVSRTTGHFAFLRYYIESTLSIELKGAFSWRFEIILSAIITVAIFAFQLFIGMQNYKKHKLQLYQGIYEDVPSAMNFNPNAIAAKSVHYSGFLVGYMAWGFVICFHLILIVTLFIRVIALRMRYVEVILAITVPVLVFYLLKMVGTSSAGKFLFISDTDTKLNLKNRKTYAIFIYFNFFADCFLGVASCIIRLMKAIFLNVVYMARLDCSFLGRPLERFDLGFAAYVSYLHMEVTHTNPIMLAFCYSLYDDVVKRRKKHCYDDECCIAPGELDEDEKKDILEQREKILKEKTASNDKQIEMKRQVSGSSAVSDQAKKKLPTIDERVKPSIKEIVPKGKSPSPSTISDKGSQKSNGKKQKSNKVSATRPIDEDEDDGGMPLPSDSTIARLIPLEQPQLPPPSAPVPRAPKRQDLPSDAQDTDDNFDDDGGLKPKSIATISTIIPHKAPRLVPVQQSASSPPIPRRQDIDESDDDDGGVNPAVIAKKKRDAEEKKKKKEKEKEKKQSIVTRDPLDDDDEDGAVHKKKKPESKPKTNIKKPPAAAAGDDDDDDGGIRPQKPKPKPKPEKKPPPKSDDDDDGVPKREPPKKKPPKVKQVVKKDVDEEVDEDGGRVVKSYNTIRTIMPSQQPRLDHAKKKEASPETADDGSMLKSVRPPSTPSSPVSKSFDTVGQIVPKLSTNAISMSRSAHPVENHYDTIPTDEERAARVAYATYSPPSYDQAATASDLQLLRTISYREAQHNTPPLIQRRPTLSSSIRSQSNTNEDSSHYSEIPPNEGVINRSYSHTGSIQSTSSQSLKQQSLQRSEPTLKEDEETEDTAVGTEEEEEDDEEEEEEEEEEEVKPVLKARIPDTNRSTAYSTLAYLAKRKEGEEINQIKRQRQARFRWFLAYTILNNYHLFDLRKQAQSRLALLRIQRSSLIDDQQYATMGSETPVAITVTAESPDVRQRTKRMAKSPTSPELRPPPVNARLLSVPVPVVNDLPQSPAERYIAIRSCMLYDALGQPFDAPRSPGVSQAPSVVIQTRTTPGARSLGFQPEADTRSAQSKEKRPSYQRQASQFSTPLIITNASGTPIFQPVPDSTQSTADYPLGNASTITSSSTLRTQMSHAQHMQAWRQNRARKIQKHRPNCYVYGSPPQRPMEEKLSTAAILTPQVIVTSPQPQDADGTRRPASSSPFQFPRGEVRTLNETSTAREKKSLRTTTAVIHQKDSQSTTSNATEV